MTSLTPFKNLSQKYFPEFLLLFSCVLTLLYPDLSWFNTHMARDLFRAQQWLHGNFSDWLGPEMGWDYKRLPGPFLYWLLAVLSAPGSVHFVVAAKIVLTYAAIYALVRELRATFDEQIAVVFLLLFLLMPVFFFTGRDLWNPSWIVLFNCLQFLFFLKLKSSGEKRWVLWAFGTALAGMQVHFSTLIPYAAAVLTVLAGISHRGIKKTQTLVLAALLLWLGVWYFSGAMTEFNSQLSSFYGPSHYLFERLQDFSSHISLSLLELKDYDLFTLHFKVMSEFDVFPASLFGQIVLLLNWLYLLFFVFAVFRLVRNAIGTRNVLSVFLLFCFLFFSVSLLLLKNKEHAPYRYGLCFYPFQFFILAYGLWGLKSWNQRLYRVFTGISAFTFIFYIFFNGGILIGQEISGRAHHTNQDNLELTLGHKQYLYRTLAAATPEDEDPFTRLHGRTAAKFRLKEMNWEQTRPYFSLYSLITGRSFEIQHRPPSTGPHWLLQLSNLSGLKSGHTALSLSELSGENLPRNVKIQYFDESGTQFDEISFADGEMILPMAFIQNPNRVRVMRLRFFIRAGGFMNVLVDDNRDYRFAYRDVFRDLRVQINGHPAGPVSRFPGFFLVQDQYAFPLAAERGSEVEIELTANVRNRNFARVDIFSTADILEPEELFPKTEK